MFLRFIPSVDQDILDYVAAHPASGREVVRYSVLRARKFDHGAILELAARHHIPDDERDAVVAYAHEQFKGLHEGNLIRYRLTLGDIEGVDLS